MSYVSFNEGLSLCLETSSNPNLEILAIWILALSEETALLKAFSTFFCDSSFSISIKSITINPPTSLNLNCLAISLADSKFVLRAVSSISLPLVDRAELISIVVIASVGSITMDPPDGREISL